MPNFIVSILLSGYHIVKSGRTNWNRTSISESSIRHITTSVIVPNWWTIRLMCIDIAHKMVPPTGIEPVTSRLSAKCSIPKLSYGGIDILRSLALLLTPNIFILERSIRMCLSGEAYWNRTSDADLFRVSLYQLS
jgi:hypothetical protein